jgi:N-acetylglucosamine-6-phosphate deacetylase
MTGPSGADRFTVAGGTILVGGSWTRGDVRVVDGLITGIERTGGAAGSDELVATGLMVVPGFIDLQVNGAFGHDITARPESLWDVGVGLVRFGVTGFLPTVVSSPEWVVHTALDGLRQGPPPGYAGARPLGLHCEGPMLSPARRGAHHIRFLRPPSAAVIEGWSREAGVRMVTLAPELEGAEATTRELVARGVVVSIGHTDATFEQATDAFTWGVGAGTHLFNGMSGFHHRSPGAVGALLASKAIPAGLIVDGEHVHPGAVAAAWRAKGPDGLFLVTDAVAALRAGADTAEDGEPEVRGAARDRSGALTGGATPLDQTVRNLVAWTGAESIEAIAAVTSTPARVVGVEGLGSVEPGAQADLALLDGDLRVVATVVGGRVVFDRRVARSQPSRTTG